MAEDVIRARRIEVEDAQGNLAAVLDGGGTEEGQGDYAGLILYGPNAESAVTIAMHGESGNPSIHLYTTRDTSIIITFTTDGAPMIRMVEEDGSIADFVPPES